MGCLNVEDFHAAPYHGTMVQRYSRTRIPLSPPMSHSLRVGIRQAPKCCGGRCGSPARRAPLTHSVITLHASTFESGPREHESSRLSLARLAPVTPGGKRGGAAANETSNSRQ